MHAPSPQVKVAVVTGGTAGIGLATAELLAKRGWDVAILARDEHRLREVETRLSVYGGQVLIISADVADNLAVDSAAKRIESELGPITAWVNNAMSTVVAPADEISAAEYQRVTATTYLSQVYGTLAALRYMKPRRRGAIVQVSSGLGIRAAPLQAAYCGAKFAVSGFTDALRAELIADELPITLSVVYLPAVNTPQPSWARNHTGRAQILPDPLFDPRLCAEAIVSAITDPQRELWVGRSTLMMAIGQALFPSFADRQASAFREKQLGAPQAEQHGNLDIPVAGPARIDGESGGRTSNSRNEFFTSTQRDLLKLAIGGGLVAFGAALGVAFSETRPRLFK